MSSTWILLAGLEAMCRQATSRSLLREARAESAATREPSPGERLGQRKSGTSPPPRVLRGPSLEGWTPRIGPGDAPRAEDLPNETYPMIAVVDSHQAPLYPSPGARHAIGWAHVGTWLPAAEVEGRRAGCQNGSWYRTTGGAYFCTGDGFRLRDAVPAPPSPDPRPDVSSPSPFAYVRVINDNAVRLDRRPTRAEAIELEEAMERGDRYRGGLVERRLQGIYFLAVVGKETVGDIEFYRTVRGKYVRAADVEPRATPAMYGEPLDGELDLPIAFVLDETTLHCHRDGKVEACGVAEKHARFAVERMLELAGAPEHPDGGQDDRARWVLGPGGIALPEDAVRIARRIDRPGGVPERTKWIHVDLARQTLVAYEGDQPVYVTLVSSGRKGYETPTGLFRVERKYLSKTMRGKDDVDGFYEIQEVPWTMFYDRNYAIHGAYWHDAFGRVRSHGCTNLPPADARWLYYWSNHELPQGWHSMVHKRGTYFYFTSED